MSAPNIINTGHNAEGKAIFIDPPHFKNVNPHVSVIYANLADGRIDTNDDADIKAFNDYDPATAGLIPTAGSVTLITKWPPGCDSADKIHRTLSVDTGVMIEGEIECVLEGGAKKTIKKGEILIQRGTKHYWRNPSSTETARMLCFVLPMKPIDGVKD